MSAEFKGCVRRFIYFLGLLQVKYNCAKFYHCRIFVAYFKKGALFSPHPLSVSSPENAHREQGYFTLLDSLSLALPHSQSINPSTTSLSYICTWLPLQLIYNVFHKPKNLGKFTETQFSSWEMGNNSLKEVDLHKFYIMSSCTKDVKAKRCYKYFTNCVHFSVF